MKMVDQLDINILNKPLKFNLNKLYLLKLYLNENTRTKD